MTNVAAIKQYMTRKDNITPEGGRDVNMAEFRALTNDDRVELGALAAKEMGETIDAPAK